MSNTSISAKFQAILTSRGFKVTASYVGGSRVAISGTPAEVAKASHLIGLIYDIDHALTLPAEEDDIDDEAIVWFKVPSPEAAQGRYGGAVKQAKALGYA